MVAITMEMRRRQWQPTPVLLPGKSHEQRSLEGCSPWGCWGSDTTEQLHFHFSLSCIGEGNGNPPQCSCLENPRDGGAWWAAIYGVTQSWTWLKWLSNSNSNEDIKSGSIGGTQIEERNLGDRIDRIGRLTEWEERRISDNSKTYGLGDWHAAISQDVRGRRWSL